MKKIGFIGLGIMGKPMAINLVKAGLDVVVWNRTPEKCEELTALGAAAAQSPAELAARADYIITMLPDSPEVKQVVLDGGVLDAARPGTLLIDMSSISPVASREIGAALKEKGIRMLDAPVSGGEPKAVSGELAIMVGGGEPDYQEAKFLFDILGSSSCYIGPLGSGNVCKLTNQIIVACNIAALSEGLTLAKENGIAPETIWNAIHAGLAGSTVMDAKTPMIAAGNFQPGFKIDLHIKDLNNVCAAAESAGAPIPLTHQVLDMMHWLSDNAMGQLDHSALYQYYQHLLEK